MGNYDLKNEVNDKYSLRGRVFQKLREDILSGKYKEPEKLKRTGGLVQIVPNKGAYVTGITAKDVKDIYMIRSLLEGLCARLATEKITKEQMEEMEENIYLADFHASKGHMDQMAELDNRFHDILYEACDSKMLEHTLKDYHQYVLRVRQKTLSTNTRGRASNDEHRQIMEAIKSGDADKAEQLANKHMLNAYDNMVKNGLNEIYGEEASKT